MVWEEVEIFASSQSERQQDIIASRYKQVETTSRFDFSDPS
ncbi:centriolin [Phyllostomus discolor]|uniref:Centriolin n=1 Tax=Phyllostomus discolor TaxID=89673 RepID=A0A834B3S4_9CHIR|nr:centriolin [Phyllostomus discolor]